MAALIIAGSLVWLQSRSRDCEAWDRAVEDYTDYWTSLSGGNESLAGALVADAIKDGSFENTAGSLVVKPAHCP